MNETLPPWSLRWATNADTSNLLALFRRSFDAEMSVEEWRWKYPEPKTHSLLAERAGQTLAHYGGQTRKMVGLGKPLQAMHISDNMVDPRARGPALSRNGLFASIASTFIEAVMPPRGPHAFSFGFPSPRATRLGELLGLYARMDQVYQGNWTPLVEKPRGHPLGLKTLRDQANRLWQAQATALGAEHLLGIRNTEWVEHRYCRHPSGDYQAWAVRDCWRRRCSAAAVYRAHDAALELIDLLGDPNRYPDLIRALRARAGQLGKTRLFTLATESVLAKLPNVINRTPVLAVNVSRTGSFQQVNDFTRRCWLLAGDTDYR